MSAGATNMPSPVAFSTTSLHAHQVSAADDRCSLGSRLSARRSRGVSATSAKPSKSPAPTGSRSTPTGPSAVTAGTFCNATPRQALGPLRPPATYADYPADHRGERHGLPALRAQNQMICACSRQSLARWPNAPSRRSGVVLEEMTAPAGQLHVTLRDHLGGSTVR